MDQVVRVVARLVCARTGAPYGGDGHVAILYDKDLPGEDYLARSPVGPGGKVSFVFNLSRAATPLAIFERRPDLFIEVVGKVDLGWEYEPLPTCRISRVHRNVAFPKGEGGEVVTQDLGTVLL